jgi:hypothetical protein
MIEVSQVLAPDAAVRRPRIHPRAAPVAVSTTVETIHVVGAGERSLSDRPELVVQKTEQRHVDRTSLFWILMKSVLYGTTLAGNFP